MPTGLYGGFDWTGLPIGSGSSSPPTVDPTPPVVLPPEGAPARIGAFAEVSDEEHLLIYEPNHARNAADLLYWQHKGKPNIEGLVAAMAAGAQLAENTSWSVIIGASTIAGAEGVSLDKWGGVVGEFRGGLGEDDYRRFIGLRIRVNTENASEDVMSSILYEAVRPSVRGNQFGSGVHAVADGIVFQVESETFLDDVIVAHTGALMRDARIVGNYNAVVEYTVNHFAFSWEASDPTKPTPATFAGLSIPGTGVFPRLIHSGRGR